MPTLPRHPTKQVLRANGTSGKLSYSQLRQLWIGAGGSAGTSYAAAAIAMAESGGDPSAQNLKYPDHSIGLWQINQLAHKGRYGSDSQLMNPATNARAAVAVYKGAGSKFTPWSVFTNGAYKTELKRGSGLTPFDPDDKGPGVAEQILDAPGEAAKGLGVDIPDWMPANLGKILNATSSGEFWKRLGLGALGLLLVIMGVAYMARQFGMTTAFSFAKKGSK